MSNGATTLRVRQSTPAATLPVRMACGIAAVRPGRRRGGSDRGLRPPAAAPVVAIGPATVDLAPTAVKERAVRSFGTWDRTVLLAWIPTTWA